MGDFETFAINAQRFSQKRGRRPIFNANKFYPRKEERELEDLTRKELERSWREALQVALRGIFDTLQELGGMANELPEEFRKAIGKTGEKIVNGAQQNLAKFSEMTIGTPYYPPTMEQGIKTDWEATFQQLCISAETDAKARIARLVNQGKTEGMNKLQVEELVERELPADTKHRAELIARTETAKLNNAATMATYQSAGIRYYVWLASIDDRTRPTHAAMNGRICAVGEPDTWYEENPDDPLHPIRHDRDGSMYHGDPGTDYQCRCTSVPWDPRIDGKYEVKEAPEPEPKEPSKLEVSREETKKATARAKKAEGQLSILQKSQTRHESRTEEQRAEILRRWDERNVKWEVKHAVPQEMWEQCENLKGKKYVESIQTHMKARTHEYRQAMSLLENKMLTNSDDKAYFRSSTNSITLDFKCAMTNKRGAGDTFMHENGHALDYAIGIAMGKKGEISEALNFGDMVEKELKKNLLAEAELFVRRREAKHKDFNFCNYNMQIYLKEKFASDSSRHFDEFDDFEKWKIYSPSDKKKGSHQLISAWGDIISGATGDRISVIYHHAGSYWRDMTKRGHNLGLGYEAFTHFGTLSETEEGRKLLEKYLPESYKLWKETIANAAELGNKKREKASASTPATKRRRMRRS